jgi:hypothetical protein
MVHHGTCSRPTELPGLPNLAERPGPLDPHLVQQHLARRRRWTGRRCEEVAFIVPTPSDGLLRQRGSACTSFGIQLAELSDELLSDLGSEPDRAHQAPLPMALARS